MLVKGSSRSSIYPAMVLVFKQKEGLELATSLLKSSTLQVDHLFTVP